MSQSPRQLVILVGHCGPDEWMIRSSASRSLPEATVEVAHSDAELSRLVEPGCLCLLNRVLDGDFKETHGQALIRELIEGGSRAMLVSNFEEAQTDAVAAGALPGFGKAAINEAETAERLQGAFL